MSHTGSSMSLPKPSVSSQEFAPLRLGGWLSAYMKLGNHHVLLKMNCTSLQGLLFHLHSGKGRLRESCHHSSSVCPNVSLTHALVPQAQAKYEKGNFIGVEREWTFSNHVGVPVGVIKQFPSHYCMQVHTFAHSHTHTHTCVHTHTCPRFCAFQILVKSQKA